MEEYPKGSVASSIQHFKRALDAESGLTCAVSTSDMMEVGVDDCGTGTLVIRLDGLFSAYTTSVSEDVSEI